MKSEDVLQQLEDIKKIQSKKHTLDTYQSIINIVYRMTLFGLSVISLLYLDMYITHSTLGNLLPLISNISGFVYLYVNYVSQLPKYRIRPNSVELQRANAIRVVVIVFMSLTFNWLVNSILHTL